MRHDTLRLVATTLQTIGPATVRDVATTAGLAYNTVKTALMVLSAALVPNTYPAEWEIDLANVDASLFQAPGPKLTKTASTTSVDLVQSDGWVPRWDALRPKFGVTISHLAIDPAVDPGKLAEDFAKGASTLASIAYALRQVENQPEWFELMGGDLEPTQVN